MPGIEKIAHIPTVNFREVKFVPSDAPSQNDLLDQVSNVAHAC